MVLLWVKNDIIYAFLSLLFDPILQKHITNLVVLRARRMYLHSMLARAVELS
jgi:hypothetical protein